MAQLHMVRWVRGTGTKYQIREIMKSKEIRLERFYCMDGKMFNDFSLESESKIYK